MSTVQFVTTLQSTKALLDDDFDVTIPRAHPLSPGEILVRPLFGTLSRAGIWSLLSVSLNRSAYALPRRLALAHAAPRAVRRHGCRQTASR